jgi:hypothetical protein
MSQPYLWLRQLLDQTLPELEDLPQGQEGQARAQTWFERLLVRFVERGLLTPAQQKNRVVDVRNAIRARFGDNHPALAHVGFDERTWQQINLPTHDRIEARNENQRLLRDPEQIVARAAKLLESPRFEDLAVGLGVCIGRRISELLDGHARLKPATAWSVDFTGQRKHRGDPEDFAFEIPTLAPAATVLAAWERLQVMLGSQRLDPREINNRYGHQVNQAADQHFCGLVPSRLPAAPKSDRRGGMDNPQARQHRSDALYLHLFRAVYATIAVHWFCPPRINRLVYKAEIQGHRQILEAPSSIMRRSYSASRHYDDYQIADASGENINGHQGIKLGILPGLEILRAFQSPSKQTEPLPASPTPSAESPLSSHDLPPSTMDPTETSAPDELPLTSPTAAAEPSAGEPVATAAAPQGKKPRPGTYRIHAPDRPRLDAFRSDPKQSQADNLHGVIARAEGTAQAAREHLQTQAELQTEREKVQRVGEEHQQARQELAALRGQYEIQGGELERLRQVLEQEHARPLSASPPPTAAGSALTAAVIARELLALATGGGCPPTFQARLIALATQALSALASPGTGSTAPPRKASKVPADPARFGPLFAAGQAGQPSVATEGAATPHGPQAASPAETQAPPPDYPKGSTSLVTTPTPEPSQSGDGPQEPPGASLDPAPSSNPSPTGRRRGGAADKLARALAAVLAHNQAQTARERKWALTESALARLTGCFRPAIRRFFAEHASQIEAHNLQHHLTGGHNAARGKRGDSIEAEIHWQQDDSIGESALLAT